MSDSAEISTQALTESLRTVRDKRGYLLPHHGLMAVALPGMLDDYDRLYTSLALTPRHLNRHQHEYVWLAVLIAMNEALGTHHIERFHAAGGRAEELAEITALAAFLRGATAYRFVEESWQQHLPEFEAYTEYLRAFNRLRGPATPLLAHLSAVAAHACAGHWGLLAWQIRAAYQAGVNEHHLAEALSLVMFPGSVPNFARAAGVWRELIIADKVEASEAFRAWAKLTGQGGFDEAAGYNPAGRMPGT
jgi:alkylhydroperoxidase/carboxymuconolactone decarboxylase family protein YurZ